MSTNAVQAPPTPPGTRQATSDDDNRPLRAEIREQRSRGRTLEEWKEWLVPPVVFPALLIIGIVAYAILRN